MKTTKIFGIVCIMFILMAGVQADPWSKSLDTDFTLTQNSYSDSWTGGEAGNISWVWNANGVFEKQVSPKFKFKNTSRFSFGQTHIQDKTTKNWAKPEKSTDLIDIENLGLLTLQTFVDPFLGIRLESQFLDASMPDKKFYLSPAKITESAGGAKQIYKTDKNELLTRLGFALRQIITQGIDSLGDDQTTTTNDGGFESVTDLKLTLSQTLSYTSKLSLYKALYFSESDVAINDNRKAVDINWENRISASVAKYVTVSLYTQLLYDKEITLKGRFKQTLALGLTYKMF